jgi:hypothetical protein
MVTILKGGLEADEQIALLRVLSDKRGADLIDELIGGLLDRPGLVRIRRRNADNRLRVHAAAPFAGGERRGAITRRVKNYVQTLCVELSTLHFGHMFFLPCRLDKKV